MPIKYVNVLYMNCASVFQFLAAENLNEVCPHLVLTGGRSNNVESLRDRQCLCVRHVSKTLNGHL